MQIKHLFISVTLVIFQGSVFAENPFATITRSIFGIKSEGEKKREKQNELNNENKRNAKEFINAYYFKQEDSKIDFSVEIENICKLDFTYKNKYTSAENGENSLFITNTISGFTSKITKNKLNDKNLCLLLAQAAKKQNTVSYTLKVIGRNILDADDGELIGCVFFGDFTRRAYNKELIEATKIDDKCIEFKKNAGNEINIKCRTGYILYDKPYYISTVILKDGEKEVKVKMTKTYRKT